MTPHQNQAMSDIKTRELPRIAIVINIPTPYSIPVYQRLGEKLGFDNFHVIYCSATEDNRAWLVDQKGFAYTFLKKNYSVLKGRYIHYNPDVLKILRQLDPDVVFTAGFNPTHLLAFGYTIFYNKVHIPLTDGTLESEQQLSVLHRIVRRIVYRSANAFVGASLGSFKLYNSYGIRREEFFQSHLCANNSAFQPSATGKRTFDLMFSGRFAAEKNPLFVLNVAAGVAKALNRKVSILLLGSGALLEQAREFASTLTIDVEATFTGFVQQEELPGFYCSARLFLFPSAGDAWGVVANEACAAGQAVIVSPYAGVANELVCHGENGYVLELELALWVKHATDLLSNGDLLDQFSKDSLLKVQAYTYDAAAKGIIDAVFAAREQEISQKPAKPEA